MATATQLFVGCLVTAIGCFCIGYFCGIKTMKDIDKSADRAVEKIFEERHKRK